MGVHYLQAECHLPNVEHIQVLQDVQPVLHLCSLLCPSPSQNPEGGRVPHCSTVPPPNAPMVLKEVSSSWAEGRGYLCSSALLLDPCDSCDKLPLPTTVPGPWWEPGMGGKESEVKWGPKRTGQLQRDL